jgi:nitrile hydratase alpha subunit
MHDAPEHDEHGPGAAHRHPARADIDAGPPDEYQFLAEAVRELLVEKGLLTNDEIRTAIETMDRRGPHIGAKIVARAWSRPDYKARLLADANAAIGELGIDPGAYKLIALENTPSRHNLVVCTLCSCYPRAILGLPPDWYKARAYRSRAVREPRAVLAEFGTVLPESVEIRVHDSTADMRYLVLPLRPPGTEDWSEAQLEALVTRDTMIGVAAPKHPAGASR